MKASLLQRNVQLVALVLQGLYEAQQEIKAGLGYWKARNFASPEDEAAADALAKHRKALPKITKRIKKIEELQKHLKECAKHYASLEHWSQEDDAFWLEEAKLAQEEGYAEFARTQAFLAEFEGEE